MAYAVDKTTVENVQGSNNGKVATATIKLGRISVEVLRADLSRANGLGADGLRTARAVELEHDVDAADKQLSRSIEVSASQLANATRVDVAMRAYPTLTRIAALYEMRKSRLA